MGFLIALLVLGVALGSKGAREYPRPPDPTNVHQFEYGPFTVQLLPKGKGWQWAIWWSSLYDVESGVEQPRAPLADGMAVDEVQAAADAKAWADAQAEGGQPAAITRHGVRVSADCSSIQVVSVEDWIDHAAPRVRQAGADLSPGELMADALLAAFPDCTFDENTQIRGRPWPEVEQRVAKIMQRFEDGELDSVEPPEHAIAARLVAMSAPSRPGEAVIRRYGETAFLIVVEPYSGGGWQALVWDNPWREGDPVQAFEKATGAAAKALALQWVDGQAPQQAHVGE